MIYALVDKKNVVANLIEYDGESPYTPPKGLILLPAPEGCQIGEQLP